MQNDYLAVGLVIKPQGIEGLVKVKPLTDNPDRFLDLSKVYVEKQGAYHPLELDNISVREGYVYLSLDGSDNRDAAEAQRGLLLHVSREDAVKLPEDRYFIVDLIGCRIQDTKGKEIGVLREVLQPGANDVYVIEMSEGRMLLPALKKVVLSVDTREKAIVIDEQLLDEVAVIED